MQFKIIPLVLSAIFLFLLPKLLKRATDKNAGDLIGDPDVDDTLQKRLEGLLNWRDFTISIITGLFVLQVAAVEKITSNTNLTVLFVHITLGTFALYLIFLIMFMIVVVWFFSDRLEAPQMLILQGRNWWLSTGFILVVIYALTGFFLVSS